MLNPDLAEQLSRVALANVTTEFPYKLDQVLAAEGDLALPRALHPAFWGSYDWHSCVHMHWTLVRLVHRFPAHALARAAWAHLDSRLTSSAISCELATLAAPHRQTFERPYGWGWLLKLAAELEALAHETPAAVAWRDAVRPLADAIAERFIDFLPRAAYPTRAGAHGNSAFALLLALDWCEEVQHRALRTSIEASAQQWFSRDRRYPASYEPGGDDFLAAGLVEAALMKRVLAECDFADWWDAFQPTDQALETWLEPVAVSDSRDAKIVHLHGVNLSRAWCWQQLHDDLPAALWTPVQCAIDVHFAASLPAATAGDYVATHWLASFALLALDAYARRAEQSS
jgi:hypothetical protein